MDFLSKLFKSPNKINSSKDLSNYFEAINSRKALIDVENFIKNLQDFPIDKLPLESTYICASPIHANQLSFECLDCGGDFDYHIICKDCFLNADHTGHKIRFTLARSGGCCDCGDENALNKIGFCGKHLRGEEKKVEGHPDQHLISCAVKIKRIMTLALEKAFNDIEKENSRGDFIIEFLFYFLDVTLKNSTSLINIIAEFLIDSKEFHTILQSEPENLKEKPSLNIDCPLSQLIQVGSLLTVDTQDKVQKGIFKFFIYPSFKHKLAWCYSEYFGSNIFIINIKKKDKSIDALFEAEQDTTPIVDYQDAVGIMKVGIFRQLYVQFTSDELIRAFAIINKKFVYQGTIAITKLIVLMNTPVYKEAWNSMLELFQVLNYILEKRKLANEMMIATNFLQDFSRMLSRPALNEYHSLEEQIYLMFMESNLIHYYARFLEILFHENEKNRKMILTTSIDILKIVLRVSEQKNKIFLPLENHKRWLMLHRIDHRIMSIVLSWLIFIARDTNERGDIINIVKSEVFSNTDEAKKIFAATFERLIFARSISKKKSGDKELKPIDFDEGKHYIFSLYFSPQRMLYDLDTSLCQIFFTHIISAKDAIQITLPSLGNKIELEQESSLGIRLELLTMLLVDDSAYYNVVSELLDKSGSLLHSESSYKDWVASFEKSVINNAFLLKNTYHFADLTTLIKEEFVNLNDSLKNSIRISTSLNKTTKALELSKVGLDQKKSDHITYDPYLWFRNAKSGSLLFDCIKKLNNRDKSYDFVIGCEEAISLKESPFMNRIVQFLLDKGVTQALIDLLGPQYDSSDIDKSILKHSLKIANALISTCSSLKSLDIKSLKIKIEERLLKEQHSDISPTLEIIKAKIIKLEGAAAEVSELTNEKNIEIINNKSDINKQRLENLKREFLLKQQAFKEKNANLFEEAGLEDGEMSIEKNCKCLLCLNEALGVKILSHIVYFQPDNLVNFSKRNASPATISSRYLFALNSCRHEVHQSCHLESLAKRIINNNDIAKYFQEETFQVEYFCPMCKRLSNCVLPQIDHTLNLDENIGPDLFNSEILVFKGEERDIKEDLRKKIKSDEQREEDFINIFINKKYFSIVDEHINNLHINLAHLSILVDYECEDGDSPEMIILEESLGNLIEDILIIGLEAFMVERSLLAKNTFLNLCLMIDKLASNNKKDVLKTHKVLLLVCIEELEKVLMVNEEDQRTSPFKDKIAIEFLVRNTIHLNLLLYKETETERLKYTIRFFLLFFMKIKFLFSLELFHSKNPSQIIEEKALLREKMEGLLLPYVDVFIGSLASLFNVPEEFKKMFMNCGSEGERMNNFKDLFRYFFEEESALLNEMIKLWVSQIPKFPQKEAESAIGSCYVPRMEVPYLGKTYLDFVMQNLSKKCSLCNFFPNLKGSAWYLCLICGELLCSFECKATNSAGKTKSGNLNYHANKKHLGRTIYISHNSSKIILFDSPRLCNKGKLYYNDMGIAISQKEKDWENYKLDEDKLIKYFAIIQGRKISEELCYHIMKNEIFLINKDM